MKYFKAKVAAGLAATLMMFSAQAQDITPAEARAIAKEAYAFGYPIVDTYRIQYSYFVDKENAEYKGAWNEVHNTARVYTPDDRAIQSPNSDTPYSFVGADLRAEPLVVTVPAVDKSRYYSLQFIDMYTFNFAYVGSRATGSGAGSYLLVGPDWSGKRPRGIKAVIRSETEFAYIMYRTQLFGADDIENVKKVQAGYKVQTLSEYLRTPTVDVPDVEFMKPLSREEQEKSIEFFNVLNFTLQFMPTHESEKALMKRFAKLGIGAGKTIDVAALKPEIREAIQAGMADAWKAKAEIDEKLNTGEVDSGDAFGSREHLKNNYVLRMSAAVNGIYGNSKDEALYPSYFVDSQGVTLDGQNKYVLKFAKGQLPPVNAFWSITMYSMPERLLVKNPLNRYLINSSMLPDLKKDESGGITIYIQHESPGADKESNWLPAPAGPFFAALRLYWPKKEALNKTWKAPKMEKVEE